jgi:methionyl-tRNA formyltransferase
MNIVLLLNNDIASNLALNLLLPTLSKYNVSVFLSSKVGGKSSRPAVLQDLARFEQEEVYQILGSDQAKGSQLDKFKNYPDLAKQYGITIELLNEINTAEGIKKIQALSADLIISIRYGVILKSPIIALAKYGVINLHSGLLPDYRGVMATFWAMLNGEDELVATLHYIADGTIDTGGIIANTKIKVHQEKSYLWHVLSLYVGGCKLIEQAIENVISNSVLKVSVQPNDGCYYSFPNEEQLTQFTSKFGALYRKKEIERLLSSLMTKNNAS